MFTAHSQSQSRWYLRHDAVIKHPNKDEPSKMSSISCEIIGKNQNNRSNNHHNGHSTKIKAEKNNTKSIKSHRSYYEALIEALRLFCGKTKNIQSMILRLQPLYAEIVDNNKEKTLREQASEDAFKFDLLSAWKLVEQYKKTKNESDMLRAWEYYRRVYNKIDQQFDKMTELDLQYVSPHLYNANNLKVIIPGTYTPNNDANNISNNHIYIHKFNQNLSVFVGTTQRPRKLTILGSDGNNYTFLLKGKEDLRQDERVMQLFSLINKLLKSSNDTSKTELEIRTYSVIPLAPNCGMIGWVSFTDTIHALIEQYRESQNPPLIFGIEHEFVKEEYINYDNLPTINKLEIFKYALNITKGNGLQQLFWLKSLIFLIIDFLYKSLESIKINKPLEKIAFNSKYLCIIWNYISLHNILKNTISDKINALNYKQNIHQLMQQLIYQQIVQQKLRTYCIYNNITNV